MGAMFNNAFNAFSILFQAFASLAMALLHLANWSEKTAEAFSDEAAVEREKKLAALRASQAAQAKQIAQEAGTPAP